DDDEVSLLVADDCASPEIVVDDVSASDDGALSLHASFRAGADGEALDASRMSATMAGGGALSIDAADEDSGTLAISGRDIGPGKHPIVLRASDQAGRRSDEARATAWVRPRSATWQDAVVYQVIVDRFRGDDGAPLAPPATPGAR